MDEILILSILIIFIVLILYYGRKNTYEAFADTLVNKIVSNNLGSGRKDYIEKGADNYNPLMNLMNPSNNTLLNPNYTEDERSVKEGDVRNALMTAKASASNPSFNLAPSNTNDIRISKNSKGTARHSIRLAETVKSIDCNAFDNVDFAANSGICHEGGEDSGGNPMFGGLYISEDDKETAEIMAERMNSKEVNYTPTVGKCDPYRFSTSKQQCLNIQNEINCIKKQSFDVKGCGMCFEDDSYHYIEPAAIYTPPSFVFVGSGTLTYSKVGSTTPQTLTLSEQPQTIEATDLNEGDVVQLNVTPSNSSLAGYLIGQTSTGDFRIDLSRLVQSDIVSGSRPRFAGVMSVDSDTYTLMKPARGKSSMNLSVLNTFSFLDSSEYAAQKCTSSPYIKSPASLKLLNSSPCYKNGQKPGEYSLECLQQTFQSAGCSAEGSGYPSNTASGQKLMTDSSGKALSIGEIAALVYNNSILAYTGKKADGTPLSMDDWSIYSDFCFGQKISSPCDILEDDGVISTDCLNYLWQNSGENSKSIGNTYTSSNKLSSLDVNDNNRFCTPNGTMAPIDKSGNQNQAAISAARSKGSIANVKSFYDGIHSRANNNSLTDDNRKDAVQQCYGINFMAAPPVPPSPPEPYNSNVIYNVGDHIIYNRSIYKMVEGGGIPGLNPDRPGDKLWQKVN
jgi:hypothetical protein